MATGYPAAEGRPVHRPPHRRRSALTAPVPYRPVWIFKGGPEHHICPDCLRIGDIIEFLGTQILVAAIRPYSHPSVVPAGETWCIADDASGRGITIEQQPFCPNAPMPGSVLPCGCWMRVGYTDAHPAAQLCPTHEQEVTGPVAADRGGAS